MQKAVLLFSIILAGPTLCALSPVLSHEVNFYIDNDIFLPKDLDKYYSFSMIYEYRWLMPSQKAKQNKIRKRILNFRVGQEIYTPEKISAPFLLPEDHPYAGWLYFSAGADFFFKNHSKLSTYAELGTTGERSGSGALQKAFHRRFKMVEPKLWHTQISSEIGAHLFLDYQMAIYEIKWFRVTATPFAKLGTLRNYLGTSVFLEIGKIAPYLESSSIRSRLGTLRPSREKRDKQGWEFIFLLGAESHLVFHNTFLEGSLWGIESPHTVEPNFFLWKGILGFMLGHPVFDIAFDVYFLSREFKGALPHHYARISFQFRL